MWKALIVAMFAVAAAFILGTFMGDVIQHPSWKTVILVISGIVVYGLGLYNMANSKWLAA